MDAGGPRAVQLHFAVLQSIGRFSLLQIMSGPANGNRAQDGQSGEGQSTLGHAVAGARPLVGPAEDHLEGPLVPAALISADGRVHEANDAFASATGRRAGSIFGNGDLRRDGAGWLLDTPGGTYCVDFSAPAGTANVLMLLAPLQADAGIERWWTDPEGNVSLNAAFAERVGVSPGRPAAWDALIHPRDRAAGAELQAAAAARSPLTLDVRLRAPDGTFRWHRLSGSPGGNGLAGTASDIEDEVRANARGRVLAKQLSAVLAAISDGLVTFDRSWTCTYVNERGASLLGAEPVRLLGRTFWLAFASGPGATAFARCREAVARGEQREFEFLYAPLRRWFAVSASPHAAGLTVVFRDITERHAREERLTLLEAAVANMDDAVIITEAEADDPAIVYVNDAFTRTTGHRREEVLGESARLLEGPETDADALAAIRRSVEAGEAVRAEVRHYKADRTPYWAELNIAPIVHRGTVQFWVAVQRDLTQRKHDLALLEWQANMLAAARDAIAVTDLDGRTVFWNRRAEELYGRGADEVMGRPLAEALGLAPEVANMAERTVLAAGYWSGRHTHHTRSGTAFPVSSAWSLIEGTDVRGPSILTIHTDITERSRLDEELSRMKRLDAVGQMTGGIAHDFNNLLTIILGSADMMTRKAEPGSDMARLARMSKSAAERGRALVTRLLAFARRQHLEPQPTDLNAVIADLCPMLEQAMGAGFAVDTSLAPGLWLAGVDRAQLEDALVNLALNARDAMLPAGGRLRIETANEVLDQNCAQRQVEVTAGEYVCVAVIDHGTGMDEGTQARAFEPFFSTRADGGTGLGLSMVFGFVKQSGGHIRITSAQGEGTTVRFWLPRSAAPEPGTPRRAPSATIAEGSGVILVVEDDDAVREQVRHLVESLGYTVRAAASSEAALEALRDGPADLVFTDMMMPGGGGAALAHRIAERWPELPVVFTSGVAGPPRGTNGPFLAKPYTLAELAHTIAANLNRNRT